MKEVARNLRPFAQGSSNHHHLLDQSTEKRSLEGWINKPPPTLCELNQDLTWFEMGVWYPLTGVLDKFAICGWGVMLLLCCFYQHNINNNPKGEACKTRYYFSANQDINWKFETAWLIPVIWCCKNEHIWIRWSDLWSHYSPSQAWKPNILYQNPHAAKIMYISYREQTPQ